MKKSIKVPEGQANKPVPLVFVQLFLLVFSQ